MPDDLASTPAGPEDSPTSGPDPLSGEALREKLRHILSEEQDSDTTMKAIVTAVTKLGVDIGVRRSSLPYPLSREDRIDRMKVLLESLPGDELVVISRWLQAFRNLSSKVGGPISVSHPPVPLKTQPTELSRPGPSPS